MLKLYDYRAKTKGLPDLLPYAALVAPGIVLRTRIHKVNSLCYLIGMKHKIQGEC